MTQRIAHLLITVTSIAWLMSGPDWLSAQQPDNPFGAEPLEEVAPAMDEDDAAAAPSDPDDVAPVEGAAPAEPVVENDPIVLAIQDSNPRTPEQLARAIEILLDAKRVDVAKNYLTQLIDAVSDDEELLKLHQRKGPTWFLRLARVKELAPDGQQLARRAWQLAHRAARDPARVNSLLNALENRQTRGDAAEQLLRGGSAVVPAVIAALDDPSREPIYKPLQSVLLSLGPDATEPMVAALDKASPDLAVRLITVLDASDDQRALPKLVELSFAKDVAEPVQQAARRAIASPQGRLPPLNAVEKFLTDRFLEAFRDRILSRRTKRTSVAVWQRDPNTNELMAVEATAADAERHQALQLAQSLLAVFPENSEYRLWLVAARLEAEQAKAGEEGVLAEEIAVSAATLAMPGSSDESPPAADPALVNGVMKLALGMNRSQAAIAAANLLAAIGSEEDLHVAGGDLSPLAEALQNTDPRVQFAAALAIIRINPTRSFAGSNRFRDVLAFMLASAGEPKALLATPRLDEGQTWGGWLNEFGWDSDVVTAGSDVIKLINERPVYDFILVSDSIDNPSVMELVQLIRHTSGGGEMAVAVICREANYERMKQEFAGQELVLTLPRPHDDQGARFIVSEVAGLPGRRMPAPEIRVQYASTALDWIQLTVNSQAGAIYDLLQLEATVSRLLYDSPLEIKAAQTLGAFGTASAQRQLLDIASQTAYSAELRKAAAQAFAQALSQRGVMLTSGEILQQYERYNASATLDQETQEILGSVLDALEAPRKAQASSE